MRSSVIEQPEAKRYRLAPHRGRHPLMTVIAPEGAFAACLYSLRDFKHRTVSNCMLLEGCEGHNGEVKSNHEQSDNDTGTM